MNVSLIVAHSKNYAIGKNNKLLWHLSDDLKNFKRVTFGHCIVMGRKTYESIGKPLPKRTNIIITRNSQYKAPGCIVMGSIEEAIEFAKDSGEKECVICGGGEIYKQSIPLINKAYITLVDCHIPDADAFFEPINFADGWVEKEYFLHKKDAKNEYDWKFSVYSRNEV